ncbi:hypothetical protein GCM10011346_24550 [Oceanobacillus neutriphilus]|uniref:tRNA/rRNA methyltransferase SpoU type domain-containing protein n=1 Tax=Oceanobacillus neutriphilus TaxID=531815 RepID=A0ABQ2NVM7_9BACI|nr:hypothetical protein GCM10011346_24550 [Oceanobacillus neutriphilus]
MLLYSKVQNNAIRKVIHLCNQKQIRFEVNDKLINKLSTKDNCYAIGVFKKQFNGLAQFDNHIVLDRPGDMGNMGTIIRTAVGFGIINLGIILPAVDVYNPKVVRSSMGSIFKTNIQYFESFQEYMNNFHNAIYTFRLDGKIELHKIEVNKSKAYTLVFGNESSGLPDDYQVLDDGIVIRHTQDIDSLNLAVSVGIAAHHFRSV